MNFQLKLGISARHAHLNREDMDKLFGEGSELTYRRPITQPGQYTSEEQITLVGPKGEMKLRIIGPLRPYTQMELAFTDVRNLGLTDVPIRLSGDLEGSAGAKLVGPKGEIELTKGIIVPARHLHLFPESAEKYGLKDGDVVTIKTTGQRAMTFHNVIVRAGEAHADEIHLDTDEANACNLDNDALIDVIVEKENL